MLVPSHLLRLAFALTLPVIVLSSPTMALAIDTIYLVRHAEKQAGWPSERELDALQPLAAEGIERAQSIATRLTDAPIVAVYTSRTTRTAQTGLFTALARECPLVIEPRSAEREAIAAWIAQLRVEHPGPGAVLIVGHSNTIPWYLEVAGAEPSCHERLGVSTESYGLATEGYDGLWTIDLDAEGCSAVLRSSLEE